MTTGLNVRKRGEYHWEITDRRKKSALQVIDLRYSVKDRQFKGDAKRRYTKVSPWQKWKPVTPAQIELAKRAIGPEELARCIRASLGNLQAPKPDPDTPSYALYGASLRVTMPDGSEVAVSDAHLPSLP